MRLSKSSATTAAKSAIVSVTVKRSGATSSAAVTAGGSSPPALDASRYTDWHHRSDEHEARDCPEPRSAADVECRSCGQSMIPPSTLIRSSTND